MDSQSREFINENGVCAGHVKRLLIGDMFRPRDAQHSSVAQSVKDVHHVLH